MKKLFGASLMALALLFATGSGISDDGFANESRILYAKIFEDGAQTTQVNAMYDDYVEKYSDYEGEELYEAVVGMYNGVETGEATPYQLEAMRLLNE